MSDNTTRVVGECYRSWKGDVVHLAPCRRMGRLAVQWEYADGKSLHEVAGFVNASEWLRLCRSCWPSAALPSGVQS